VKIGYSARMASNPQCRCRAPARRAGTLLALTLTAALCACSSLGDNLPASIGLPAGAPERPAVQPEFLPVQDTPPPRDTKPLTEPERKKLEADLKEIRDNQEQRTGKVSLKQAGEKTRPKRPAVKPSADGQPSAKSPD
jgi:hypothetical protein